MRTIDAFAALITALAYTQHATPNADARLVVASADAAVSIRTFQFAPDTLRVKAGTRVVWTNTDEIEHTVTSGSPESQDGRFSGVVTKRGASYSAVLKEAGTYRYFCDRHRFMNGTVIVNPRGKLP
jgi:plastocyanin